MFITALNNLIHRNQFMTSNKRVKTAQIMHHLYKVADKSLEHFLIYRYFHKIEKR